MEFAHLKIIWANIQKSTDKHYKAEIKADNSIKRKVLNTSSKKNASGYLKQTVFKKNGIIEKDYSFLIKIFKNNGILQT